jgi:hypothetical protein
MEVSGDRKKERRMNSEKENTVVAVDPLKPERVQEEATVRAVAGAVPSPAPGPDPGPQPKKKSKPSAFSDVVREWESLLAAVEARLGNRVGVEPHRAALAQSVDKARTTKTLQETHDTNRQSTTQDLKAVLVEGKDRMIRLRGAIRAELGPTTEQLKQFGIRPIRRRLLQPQDTAPSPGPELAGGKTGKEGA